MHSLRAKYPKISQLYTQQFPATSVNKKLDVWDLGLSFSSELIVAGVVVVVGLINLVVFNPLKAEYIHNDSSFAAQLLQRHSEYNPQLAVAQNTISTVIEDHGGLFANAYASENNVLSSTDSISALQENSIIDDSGITKPNPDNIQRLVSDQVVIYETKPFDTVYTVASQFGLSTQTIRDSNGLPNNALLAGWQLLIPPVDGVVVQIKDEELTLAQLAKDYQADINQIISYNGLTGPDDMVAMDDYLIIPGGELPEASIPAPSSVVQQQSQTAVSSYKPSAPTASLKRNNRFAAGHCTDYVARKVKVTWRGNANQWPSNARAQGYTVDRNPVAGAILVTNESWWGHVSYIEKVVGSKVYISEWNYAGLFNTTHRVIDISDRRVKAVIHP
ncbi:MAG: LysM peptidoglycan-binding domain-containing protein [Candidatus Doudnabacteria bacterium]